MRALDSDSDAAATAAAAAIAEGGTSLSTVGGGSSSSSASVRAAAQLEESRVAQLKEDSLDVVGKPSVYLTQPTHSRNPMHSMMENTGLFGNNAIPTHAET